MGYIMNMFLASWADLTEIENENYLDYEALINSDDEYLIIESLALSYGEVFNE